ncbi:unnamed protein product [Phytophthora fragariaefolia]|uniref:Unnamed protein product n=1 Tax=Phytophthora fragariaefolia TaxID=1490495 RepID=A0A9W7D2G6_9STRA|nr:unnamed protein product [Phytophthora fragariaefolia]
MVLRFFGYLQEQFEQQLPLKGGYDVLRAQMEQQSQQMAVHTSILREASKKVGHQARETETLKDVVHHPSLPRGQVRLGWFAQPPPGEADDVKMEDTTEEGHSDGGEGHIGEGVTPRSESAQHLTFAMGTNTPTPPVYNGFSRQGKKAFVDSYLVY